MANRISFNKKENEKKKISKRLEKQKRKEDRKANSIGGNFEDMIAYIDENGQITSTPPDLTVKKEEIDAASIEVSIPKRTEIEEDTVNHGKIEHFNSSKGYGFIKDSNSSEKYFFHISNVVTQVSEGDKVTFELEKGPKGINATKIQIEE